MDKKERIKMLLELERLIEFDGDVDRIFELRELLGMNEAKKQEKALDKREFPFTEEQFFRMKALGMPNEQIAFALDINPSYIHSFVAYFKKDEMQRKIDAYDEYYIIRKYVKRRRRI